MAARVIGEFDPRQPLPKGGTGTERPSVQREWFQKEMERIAMLGDAEIRHNEADKLMCYVLETLGYHGGVKAFQDMEKWYA